MCPVCREPMVAFELEGIEIDRCVDCRGTWLDAGEMEAIAELAGVEPGGLSQALHEAHGARHGKRRCPRCSRRLEIIQVGHEEPVELDRCPEGDGFWFDPGEMETFIASFEDGEEGAVARFFEDFHGKRPNRQTS